MHVIIIGCGRLGSNLAKALIDNGDDVCVIDRNNSKLEVLGSGFNGLRLKGIEFDNDNLIEAGIEKADALFAVSSDDNINITVSLIAENIYHVPKIIARVNEPGRKHIYESLKIKTVNLVQLGVKILKNRLFIDSLDTLSALDDEYEIIEFQVDKDKSTTVGIIEQNYCCVVSGIVEDGKFILPSKELAIHKGSKVICTIHKKNKKNLVNSFTKEILI